MNPTLLFIINISLLTVYRHIYQIETNLLKKIKYYTFWNKNETAKKLIQYNLRKHTIKSNI